MRAPRGSLRPGAWLRPVAQVTVAVCDQDGRGYLVMQHNKSLGPKGDRGRAENAVGSGAGAQTWGERGARRHSELGSRSRVIVGTSLVVLLLRLCRYQGQLAGAR